MKDTIKGTNVFIVSCLALQKVARKMKLYLFTLSLYLFLKTNALFDFEKQNSVLYFSILLTLEF